MSSAATEAATQRARATGSGAWRKQADRIGDVALYGICLLAAILGAVVLVAIAYGVVHGASPAISKFGIGFLTDTVWQPNFNVFGAGSLLYGTIVSSFF